MADSNQKNKGVLLQIAGVIVLVASFHGFFFLQGVLYFAGLIVGIIVFAVCLFRGGLLYRQGKTPKS